MKFSENLIRAKLGYDGSSFFNEATVSNYDLKSTTNGLQQTIRTTYSKNNSLRFNLGYQIALTNGNWQLYAGADILYWLAKGKTQSSISSTNFNSGCSYYNLSLLQSWDTNIHSIGLQPFIGIEATFSPKWFLTLEFGIPVYANLGKDFYHLNESQQEKRKPIKEVFSVVEVGVIELLDLGVYRCF